MPVKRLTRIVHNQSVLLTKRIAGVCLLVSLCCFVIASWRWPLSGDASLMHYVGFLLDRGLSPYRDIWDMNFPGAYLPDWFIQHFFGPSAIAWRMYDFFILAVVGLAMYRIARPVSRFAALWAAILFAVVHGRDGIEQLGQRDLTAAALLIAAVAFLSLSRHIERTWPCQLFGLLAGAAATIKPTLAGFVLLLLVNVTLAHGRIIVRAKHLCFGLAAWFLPMIGIAAWLACKGSISAFWFDLRVLMPFHARLGHAGWKRLLYNSCSPLSLLIGAWLLVLLIKKLATAGVPASDSYLRLRRLLLAASGLGLLSFLLQQKAYPYQRYPFLEFIVLLIALDLAVALQDSRASVRRLSAYTLLWGSIVLVPISVVKASSYRWERAEFSALLIGDLRRVSVHGNIETLNRHVACIDTVSGCVNVLENLQLIQSTPNMYDEFLFQREDEPAVRSMRRKFWLNLIDSPPGVIVVTEGLFPDSHGSYEKLLAWPEFAAWLKANYRLNVQETPRIPVHTMGRYIVPPGFRIYVKTSP